ncbi:hypothetical protein ACETK8_03720 [Brevundimonas staleyi]|uniref:Uncharacterized protein n=1 Tax=Brevundimonas staleyi TaxID=74326 RepID=A0ABW0FXQ7_9CAUL
MSPIQVMLWLLTVPALGLLAWKGRTVERCSAAAILLVVLAPLLLQDIEVGNVRWVIALTSVGLAVMLLVQGLLWDRWWLLAAAGVQGAAAATYGLAALQPEIMIWTGVVLRRIFWIELMLVALFGAWEAQQVGRYRLKEAMT